MTAATRTQSDHGTRACYLRGCRQPECEQANYQYMSRLRLDHERGMRRRRPATQVVAHAQRLLANGWSQAQISRAAGVTHQTISDLLAGQPNVSNRTALAILSVRIGPPPGDARDIDATGTIRRIRALVAMGWPVAQLAPRFGIHENQLTRIARGELRSVRVSTADTIALEYRELCRIPGPSNRTRIYARKRDWHGPLAWDDIDDPAAQPETGERREGGPGRREQVDALEVARLTAAGRTAEQIARELRCHKRTVVRARGRVQPDMAAAA